MVGRISFLCKKENSRLYSFFFFSGTFRQPMVRYVLEEFIIPSMKTIHRWTWNCRPLDRQRIYTQSYWHAGRQSRCCKNAAHPGGPLCSLRFLVQPNYKNGDNNHTVTRCHGNFQPLTWCPIPTLNLSNQHKSGPSAGITKLAARQGKRLSRAIFSPRGNVQAVPNRVTPLFDIFEIPSTEASFGCSHFFKLPRRWPVFVFRYLNPMTVAIERRPPLQTLTWLRGVLW